MKLDQKSIEDVFSNHIPDESEKIVLNREASVDCFVDMRFSKRSSWTKIKPNKFYRDINKDRIKILILKKRIYKIFINEIEIQTLKFIPILKAKLKANDLWKNLFKEYLYIKMNEKVNSPIKSFVI